MAITTHNPKRNISEIFLHDGEPVSSTVVFRCVIRNSLIRYLQYEHLDPRRGEDLVYGEANAIWHNQENYKWVWDHCAEKPTFYHQYSSAADEHHVIICAWFNKENEVLYHLTYGKAETVVYP